MSSLGALSGVAALASLVSIACLFAPSEGHGLMTYPRQRGALYTQREVPNPIMDKSAPIDHCPHCNNCGGVGTVEMNEDRWSMFKPFEYKRKGITVCGDPVGGTQAHMRTGQFGNPPSTPYSATFKPGSVANFEFDFTTNHNGFLSFFLCDVSKTGDVRNEVKFFKDNCYELERSPHPSCESGKDMECGPIDRRYPGRFVVPCRTLEADQVVGGPNGKMAYKIPNVVLKDAVVISYWLAQNTCSTPDNFMQTYNYPSAWAGCEGDGGTRGAKPTFEDCVKGRKTPEEFFNCADVRVVGGVGASDPTGPLPGSSAPTKGPGSSEEKSDGGEAGDMEPMKPAEPMEPMQPMETTSGEVDNGSPAKSPAETNMAPRDCMKNGGPIDPTEVIPKGKQCVPHFNQCGGKGYKGPTSCCDPSWKCVNVGVYYRLCLSENPYKSQKQLRKEELQRQKMNKSGKDGQSAKHESNQDY